MALLKQVDVKEEEDHEDERMLTLATARGFGYKVGSSYLSSWLICGSAERSIRRRYQEPFKYDLQEPTLGGPNMRRL